MLDLKFEYNQWLKIDFKSQTIRVKLDSLQYNDTIHIFQDEKNKILRSFEDNNIRDLHGDILYAENYRTMPPSDFKINVSLNGKPQTSITIDTDYKDKGPFPFTKRYKILSFQNEILSILDNKPGVKKAKAALLKYMSDHHIILL